MHAQTIFSTESPDLDSLALQVVELCKAGKYQDAIPLAKQALAYSERVLGPDHPDTATALNNLAEVHREMGDYAKAEPLWQRALNVREKVLGVEDPLTALSLNNLATLYLDTGEYAKAELLYERALRINEKVFGPENPETAASLNNLAELYRHTASVCPRRTFIPTRLKDSRDGSWA